MRTEICLSRLSLTVLVLALCWHSANSQDPASGSPATSSGGAGTVTSGAATANTLSLEMANEPYRIGPGDVLDVRVFNRPQLSRVVRVDPDGTIQMPLVDAPIHAACVTESELAKAIAGQYLKYQRNPYVSVFIQEFSSQPIAVVGAVEKPQQFLMKRKLRLSDVLAFAGGPKKEAGTRVEIAHTGGQSVCDPGGSNQSESAKTAVRDDADGVFSYFNLRDTLRGDVNANPYLRPGDIVRIPEAEQAYVVGNVTKPQPIILKQPTTVTQAIAMAGGSLRSSSTNRVRILRQLEGTNRKIEILVDLSAIDKRKAEDPLLMPNDIVDVPTNEKKLMFEKILNALTGGLSSVPYVLR